MYKEILEEIRQKVENDKSICIKWYHPLYEKIKKALEQPNPQLRDDDKRGISPAKRENDNANAIQQELIAQASKISILHKERDNWIEENTNLYEINRKQLSEIERLKKLIKEVNK